MANTLEREGRRENSDITANFSHEVAAMVMSNVADMKCNQHDYENAYLVYNDVFQIRKTSLGEFHLDTIMAAFNAGKCLHCLRRSHAALRYYDTFKRAILSSPITGVLNEQTITAIQSIAWMFHQERSFEFAREYYELAYRSATRHFGERHKVTARILNQCGNLYFEYGQMQFSLRCYKQGLAIEQAIGPSGSHSHLDILTTLSNIAHAYEVTGNTQESLEYAEKIIVLLRSSEGTMSQSDRLKHSAGIFLNIARLQDILGYHDLALQALADALHIQKQEYGEDHGCVAVTLNEMGIIYGNQGKTALALQSFQQSLSIRQMTEDNSDLTINPVYFNIARTHMQNEDYEKAIAQYEDVVEREMRKKETPEIEWSPDALLDALEHTADVFYNDLNDSEKALECYEQGIRLFMEINLATVPFGIQSRFLGMAGNIHLQLGNTDRAVRLFSQTMRVNLAAGWTFNSNINAFGFDFLNDNNQPPSGAPAA